jgi:hypothetical protein
MTAIHCTIEKLKTARGYDFKGVVWSDDTDSGSFRLLVRREGPNGRSTTMQEGLFAVDIGERQTLGTVSVNAGMGDAINVTLTVSSGGDSQMCMIEL